MRKEKKMRNIYYFYYVKKSCLPLKIIKFCHSLFCHCSVRAKLFKKKTPNYPACRINCMQDNISVRPTLTAGTLNDGYVRNVPLPKAPRIQSASHVTSHGAIPCDRSTPLNSTPRINSTPLHSTPLAYERLHGYGAEVT
jgi:hypothetical protein